MERKYGDGKGNNRWREKGGRCGWGQEKEQQDLKKRKKKGVVECQTQKWRDFEGSGEWRELWREVQEQEQMSQGRSEGSSEIRRGKKTRDASNNSPNVRQRRY